MFKPVGGDGVLGTPVPTLQGRTDHGKRKQEQSPPRIPASSGAPWNTSGCRAVGEVGAGGLPGRCDLSWDFTDEEHRGGQREHGGERVRRSSICEVWV